MSVDLVYTDAETGAIFATRDVEGGTNWAVPDGDGGIKWVPRRTPLAAKDEPVMALLEKVCVSD